MSEDINFEIINLDNGNIDKNIENPIDDDDDVDRLNIRIGNTNGRGRPRKRIHPVNESEPLKKKRTWSKVEASNFWETDVPKFSDTNFKNVFRVTRNTFNYLTSNLYHLERLQTNLRRSIDLKKRVAIALYAIGSTAEYKEIATLFGVGRTTAGEIVLEVCREIWRVFHKRCFDDYPPTDAKVKSIVNGFAALGFPQCYGVIDGYHIEVSPPKDEFIEYSNFEGWHSVILLAVADHRSKFTYINIGASGTHNDYSVYEQSKLRFHHEYNKVFKRHSTKINGIDIPIVLVGDSAYKLSNYLMKPYSNCSTAKQKLFNFHLSKCQEVIDNAFGQLKARFRRIIKGLDVHIDNVNVIVKACCVLHNVCKEFNDRIYDVWLEDICSRKKQPETINDDGDNEALTGKIRDTICDYLSVEGFGSGIHDANDYGAEELNRSVNSIDIIDNKYLIRDIDAVSNYDDVGDNGTAADDSDEADDATDCADDDGDSDAAEDCRLDGDDEEYFP